MANARIRVRRQAAGRERSASPFAALQARRAPLTAFDGEIHAGCEQMSYAGPYWRSTYSETWDRVWISLRTSMREANGDCTSITAKVQAMLEPTTPLMLQELCQVPTASNPPNECTRNEHRTRRRDRKARRHFAPTASAHGTSRTLAPETQQQVASDHPAEMREVRDAFLRSCHAEEQLDRRIQRN